MQKTLVSLVGLALFSALAPTSPEPTPVPTPVPTPAFDGPLVGITVASKVASVAPEQAGKIVSVPVTDGDRVGPGTVLFQLSAKLEQLEVDRLRDLAESDFVQRRAEVSLRHAEQQEQRVRDLREKDIASDRELQLQVLEVELARLKVQQAGLEQTQAKNELAQAVERLAQRTVRSPFAGIVTQRWKGEGEAVEKFVPVLEVMSLDPLWIEFDCPVNDASQFDVGGEVVVAPAMDAKHSRTAKILFVSVKATAASHTFMVRAAVDNSDLSWKAGLKMTIQHAPTADTPSKPGK